MFKKRLEKRSLKPRAAISPIYPTTTSSSFLTSMQSSARLSGCTRQLVSPLACTSRPARPCFRTLTPLRHRANKDTVIPLSEPIRGRDGHELHELVVARGTTVLIHYQASNIDKALWGADALEWRPERWLAPLPHALEDARIPGVYANL